MVLETTANYTAEDGENGTSVELDVMFVMDAAENYDYNLGVSLLL